MDVAALLASVFFAAVLLAVLGGLYAGARASQRRGELGEDGLRLLRWAIGGQLVLYAIIAVTAFLR
jgi:hypothetical protein